MKKYFIFILLLSVLLLNAVDKKKTGWEENGLKGKVKEYTIIEYKFTEKFGIMEKEQSSKIIRKYDYKGNVIEKVEYKLDGDLDFKWIFKYDNKGNFIEYAKYNSDGSLDSKHILKYDNKGNRIEEAKYKSDESLDSKRIFKYDNKGNFIEYAKYLYKEEFGEQVEKLADFREYQYIYYDN